MASRSQQPGVQARATVALVALACLVLVPSSASALEPRPGSGSPATHGEPKVRYGPIETERSGGAWTAEQRVLVTNDFGGAHFSTFDVSTFRGTVEARHTPVASTLDPGDYRILVNRTATGPTRADAVDRLETIQVSLQDHLRDDSLEAGGLAVSAAIDMEEAPRERAPSSSSQPPSTLRRADVELWLPVGPRHDVSLASERGDLKVRGAFASLSARTGAGAVDAVLESWSNGSLDLESTAGPIQARLVGGSEQGFDVLAETRGRGQASAEVWNAPSSEDAEYEVPTAQALGDVDGATSRGFEDRPVRTAVHAKARNAPATVDVGPQGPTWMTPAVPAASAPADSREPAAGQPASDPGLLDGTGWATIGLAAAGLAALWLRLRDAFPLALGRLYSRIRDDEILELETRRQIHELVRSEPGIHFRAILRRLDLGEGQLNHHLDKLLDAGVLEQTRGPGHRCLFLAGSLSRDVRRAIAAAKADGATRVLAALDDAGSGSLDELADRADLAASTASYHVSRLEGESLLETRREGRLLTVRLTTLGRRVLALLGPG